MSIKTELPIALENNASAEMVQTSSSIDAEVIRPLGVMERCLWLLDETYPTHFSIAAEIEGPTTLTSWRSAIDAVQRRHPFFSVCIDEDENSYLCFRRVAGKQIPLRVVETDKVESQWEREVERELATRIDPKQAPLIRLVLLHQPDKSILIFTAHHSIGDGISMAFAIRDTLRALAGEKLEALPPLPSMEELLGMPQTSPARPVPKTSSSPSPENVAATVHKNADAVRHVKGLRLSTELTSKLLSRSRQEGTSVHGALCAALVLAGRQVFSAWNNPVRIHSSVDVRRLLQLGENYLQLAFGGIVAINPDTMPAFWDIARFMKSGLAPAQSAEAVIAGLSGMSALLLQGLDSQALLQIAKEAQAHEATLTNLGSLPFDTSFGDLKLTSMWGPAITLYGETGQTVGAATANGSLCLLYTSSTPAPSLLEVMEKFIVAACNPHE
jgi:Condensation domain